MGAGDLLAGREERRGDAGAREDVEDATGLDRMEAVVEPQSDTSSGHVSARHSSPAPQNWDEENARYIEPAFRGIRGGNDSGKAGSFVVNEVVFAGLARGST
jgi:hypothetical protein